MIGGGVPGGGSTGFKVSSLWFFFTFRCPVFRSEVGPKHDGTRRVEGEGLRVKGLARRVLSYILMPRVYLQSRTQPPPARQWSGTARKRRKAAGAAEAPSPASDHDHARPCRGTSQALPPTPYTLRPILRTTPYTLHPKF